MTSKEMPGSVEQYARALEYQRGETQRAIDRIAELKRELAEAQKALKAIVAATAQSDFDCVHRYHRTAARAALKIARAALKEQP